MRRLLGEAFISHFHSQLRRLLEDGVYKRATFKRGNTVMNLGQDGKQYILTFRPISQPNVLIVLICNILSIPIKDYFG